jgi:hypothetical protein
VIRSVGGTPNFGTRHYLFTTVDVSIFRRSAFKRISDGKLYLVDFTKENANLDACLLVNTNMGWLD